MRKGEGQQFTPSKERPPKDDSDTLPSGVLDDYKFPGEDAPSCRRQDHAIRADGWCVDCGNFAKGE